MNRFGPVVSAVALAVVCAEAAYAQRVVEPAVPRALQQGESVPGRQLDAPPPAGGMAAPAGGGIAAAPIQLEQNVRRHARDADARHCLQRASNKDVHRCAQPYLPRGARVTRAAATKEDTPKRSAKGSAKVPAEKPAPIVAAEPPKPETLKPGAAKAEDKAKAADLVKPMDVTKTSPPAAPKPEVKPEAKAPAPAAGAPAKAAEPTKK